MTTADFSWHPEPALLGFTAPDARPALERLGADVWSAALDYLFAEAVRRPVGPESYPELRRRLFGGSGRPPPAPVEPTPSAGVLGEFRDRLAGVQFNAVHPRAFGYFTPPGLPMSVAGEVLAQWLNQGVDVWHAGPSGALVEEEVVGWLRDLIGFDEAGWGVLASGGVMANVMALTVARDVRLAALAGTARPPRGAALDAARVYASDQAHFSIARALDVLGFPAQTLRLLPSDDRFRLRADPVAAAVAEDRAAGLRPFAICAVSGSTNTGSVDDVPALADLAAREGLWLHVDAAYGGAVRLSERDAGRVPALDRADSVTIDPHKWFFQPLDIGALVVRRREDLHRTFHRSPEYYRSTQPGDEPLNWLEYSIEGTRRFRALKLWASWKHLGTRGFGRLVERTNDLAAHLAGAARSSGELEVAPAEPELSVVCLRHIPGGAAGGEGVRPAEVEDALDRHQDRLQRALEVSGEGWVSTTRLRGRTWLRAGVVNYLATERDVDRLVAVLRELGGELWDEPDRPPG